MTLVVVIKSVQHWLLINDVDILWNTGEIGNSIIIDEPGTYSATAMTAIGCSFTDDITITDRECGRFRIYVPNVFAPTGSEENSNFFVSPSEEATIIEYELRVFDRWGNNIYTTNDINAEWDGRTPTHSVQPGVFTYVIVVRYSDDFEEDRTERRSGSFTVLR